MSGLNERIRKLRNDLHLTQDYVAEFVGIRRAAVAEIESGKRNVRADELAKFSELFLVSTDELLHGTQTEYPTQVFARGFSSLSEADQREILNLIEFKRAMADRS